MGREVRRVPADWQHPKKFDGKGMRYKPLHDKTFAEAWAQWEEEWLQWKSGNKRNWGSGGDKFVPHGGDCGIEAFCDWHGDPPDREYYRPAWPEESRTHLQMYENTSEGTPISPVMASPEELARWLADNGASAFAGQTASYEAWLRVCNGGYACSAVMTSDGIVSGVEGLSQIEAK